MNKSIHDVNLTEELLEEQETTRRLETETNN